MKIKITRDFADPNIVAVQVDGQEERELYLDQGMSFTIHYDKPKQSLSRKAKSEIAGIKNRLDKLEKLLDRIEMGLALTVPGWEKV